MYLSAWDWLCCLYIIQEIKESLHPSTIQHFVRFINGIRLVLSYQIHDDLSLYYNMVAANGKYGPKMRGNQCK